MTQHRLEPVFLDSTAGRIFVLLRAPGAAERCVLIVPPFAEEMNKCRRQFTQTAEALVARGWAVLLVDLYGTGDSEGEFAEATWASWKADVAAAIAWVRARGLHMDGVLAARLGCALAADSLKDEGIRVARSVFWQPVEKGRQFMTQFLRLRVAAAMMEADGQESVEDLRARLAAGETLEIAGYELSSALWRAIEQVELPTAIGPWLGDIGLFEVGRAGRDSLSVAGQRLLAKAAERGVESSGLRITGEPFWSSTEIVVIPALVDHTVRHLAGAVEP